jgi:ATP-dependent Zn protease
MIQSLLYVDPGSGSYLVQIIAAAALGVAFFFKSLKLFIIAFFTRFKLSIRSLFIRIPKEKK